MSEQKKIKLRDYQLDIIKQTLNSDKSTLIQVPTGGGKTLIAKEIIVDLVGRLNLQVLFVAPKIILMEQTAEVFKGLNPHIVHGVNQYDKNHKVLVSTLQTASRRDINPDVIIIDEIHYGFEGKMIERLIKNKPNTRIIGLSATPYDKNGEQLKGFELILDKYDLKYMVENKHLVNIEAHVLTKIRKLETVKITGGDYNIQELSKIVCNNQTILEIVGSTAEHILKYKKAIVFAVDINHAELLTKAYQNEGFAAKVIHFRLNEEEQEREIRRFKEGQTKILVSVAMLTTGFDMPDADVAIIARPTKSQNLYKQMVGRVLRLAPNKTHAILLDCGNVIENLGMPLDPIKAMQTKEIADNQQKCENCKSKNLKLKRKDEKSFWECEDCGHTKGIEYGTYECKLCHKLYTHDAKFSIKNNKLWLDCDICPHPTLISEYTGSEIFVQVGDKYEETNNKKSLVKILEEEKIRKELEDRNTKVISNFEEKLTIRMTQFFYDKRNKSSLNEYQNFLAIKQYKEDVNVFIEHISRDLYLKEREVIKESFDIEKFINVNMAEILQSALYGSYVDRYAGFILESISNYLSNELNQKNYDANLLRKGDFSYIINYLNTEIKVYEKKLLDEYSEEEKISINVDKIRMHQKSYFLHMLQNGNFKTLATTYEPLIKDENKLIEDKISGMRAVVTRKANSVDIFSFALFLYKPYIKDIVRINNINFKVNLELKNYIYDNNFNKKVNNIFGHAKHYLDYHILVNFKILHWYNIENIINIFNSINNMNEFEIDQYKFETIFNVGLSHSKKKLINTIRQIFAEVWKKDLSKSEYNLKISDTITKIKNILNSKTI